jgi:hypothetical protein
LLVGLAALEQTIGLSLLKQSDAAAVRKLQAWRKTLSKTDITIDDLLSARDEGRK